jgi:hypothetical protein
MLFLAALPAVLLIAACGDGPDTSGTPTAEPTPADGTPRPTPAGYGPAPVLGGNIEAITPAHAAKVSQKSTVTTNQLNPKGVCAKVNFDGLPTTGQAFRFIVDGQEVTDKAVWIVASTTSPRDGTFCFAPDGGLVLGRHTAAIGVQSSTNVTDDYKQIVAWAFDVTE